MQSGTFTFDHDEKGGRFEYFLDGRLAGLLTFVWEEGSVMVFDHTEVMEGFNGLGIGKLVVEHAANYAGENGFEIWPICPYAAKVIQGSDPLKQYLKK